MTLRVHWATGPAALFGNAFGYGVANLQLMRALVDAGAVLDRDADVAVSMMYPDGFEPVPGRINALFTMYENAQVPACFPRAFAKADVVLVPSRYCAELFAPLTDRPIYVVPLGVDPAAFPGCIRPKPKPHKGRPFRWLWLGAHNLRKGWGEVTEAWSAAFVGRTDCELYLKTTDIDPEAKAVLAEAQARGASPEQLAALSGTLQLGSVRRQGNVVLDTRRVDHAELLSIYAQADGFVFPSMGEGFGLTLLEAMATALPCVAVLATGVTEFADATVCRPVAFAPHEVLVAESEDGPMAPATVIRADVPDLVRQMEWIMAHGDRARDMGRRAYRRAQQFTWEAAGQRLAAVLSELGGSHHAAAHA